MRWRWRWGGSWKGTCGCYWWLKAHFFMIHAKIVIFSQFWDLNPWHVVKLKNKIELWFKILAIFEIWTLKMNKLDWKLQTFTFNRIRTWTLVQNFLIFLGYELGNEQFDWKITLIGFEPWKTNKLKAKIWTLIKNLTIFEIWTWKRTNLTKNWILYLLIGFEPEL